MRYDGHEHKKDLQTRAIVSSARTRSFLLFVFHFEFIRSFSTPIRPMNSDVQVKLESLKFLSHFWTENKNGKPCLAHFLVSYSLLSTQGHHSIGQIPGLKFMADICTRVKLLWAQLRWFYQPINFKLKTTYIYICIIDFWLVSTKWSSDWENTISIFLQANPFRWNE